MSYYHLKISSTSKHSSNKEVNFLTREALCMSLLLLIKEKPINKIKITEIVKLAGVSRTAYYNNYSSKNDIIIDLVHSLMYEMNLNLLPYRDIKTAKAIEPSKFIKVIFEVLNKQRDLYLVLLEANLGYIILDSLNEIMLSITKELNDEFLCNMHFISGAIYNIFTKWITSKSPMTIENMIDICTRLYFKPISLIPLKDAY